MSDEPHFILKELKEHSPLWSGLLEKHIDALESERDQLKIKTSCQAVTLVNLEVEIDRLLKEKGEWELLCKGWMATAQKREQEISKLKAELEKRHEKCREDYDEVVKNRWDACEDRDLWKSKCEHIEENRDYWKREVDCQKSKCEALELEKKAKAHVSLRIMTAKAGKLVEALKDISVLNSDAYYPKGTIDDAFKIAKAAIAEWEGK